MELTTQVLTHRGELSEVEAEWDTLAVEARQPFCAPAWMLAWWDAGAPARAVLRVVVVRRQGGLVGICPLYVERDLLGVRRYRFLAAPSSLRTQPLSPHGEEDAIAAAIGTALRSSPDTPDALFFEGVSASSVWPGLLAQHLAPEDGSWCHTHTRMPAPALRIEHSSGEDWLASKSKNFREQTRRRRRKLEAKGAVFRMATKETIAADLAALARLHHSRWDERGGSGVLTPQVEVMLASAAEHLLASERFRLWMIDVKGKAISAHLFLAAGGELSYWLGGFDDAWAQHQPALQVLVAALQDSIDRGEEWLDLGGGAQPYKYRLSDHEETIHWTTVIPRGSRHLIARASTSPRRLRRAVLTRIPDDLKNRVKKALGRPVSTSKSRS